MAPAAASAWIRNGSGGRQRDQHANLATGIALASLLLAGGCAEEPLPQRQLRSDDCLQNVRLDQLPEQIRRCDAVVAAFPTHPGPLNDRYLLNSLAGREQAACQDIAKASALARTASVDPQVQQELKVRRELCRDPQHNIANPPPAS